MVTILVFNYFGFSINTATLAAPDDYHGDWSMTQ
jgi:hypothetical protein